MEVDFRKSSSILPSLHLTSPDKVPRQLRSSPFRLYWPLNLEVCLSLPGYEAPHSDHQACTASTSATKLSPLRRFSVSHAFLNRFLRIPWFLVQMPKDVYYIWSCSFFCGISKTVSHSAFFCFLESIPKWSLKGNMNSWPKIPYCNSNTRVLELLQPETKHCSLPRFSLVSVCV